MNHILIVDDYQKGRNALEESFRLDFPDDIILTADGEAKAIEILNSKKVDVVITDLMMGDKQGGVTVLREAKKVDPLIMVILITAFEEMLDRKQAFELGAFDCLFKGSPGVRTADELSYKTKSAIHSRNIAKDLIKMTNRVDSFKKYFDPKIFDKIKDNPTLLDPHQKPITIIFWDIRGFSLFSEKLKAHTDIVAGFLKDFYELTSMVIFKNDGILDKFIGDGVMALFGAFCDSQEAEIAEANSAVRAAVELRNSFGAVVKKWERKWELCSPESIDIGLGCGIHTGLVIVGNLGTDIREQYTAIGAHVNLTARIQASAKANEIRISSTTKSRVQSNFQVKKVETLTNIKNIPGNYDIYIVENEIKTVI